MDGVESLGEGLDGESDWNDRVSALEQRLLQHDQTERSTTHRAPIAGVIALAGIGLGVLVAVSGSLVFVVLAAATVLVLFGLGSRTLAITTTVSTVAAVLIAFAFVPALHDMNSRAEDAVNSIVGTVTTEQQNQVSAPVIPTLGPIAFPTYGPIDAGDDRGAELLGPSS